MNDARIEAIELRGSAGLGVFLRVGDDQRVFRVAPVRDPRQPRFWCLAAFECSACGIQKIRRSTNTVMSGRRCKAW